MNMYLVTIPGTEPRNVIAKTAEAAMREAAEVMGLSGIQPGTECQRVNRIDGLRGCHPWRAWNPGMLKSDSKEIPLNSEHRNLTAKRNRAI